MPISSDGLIPGSANPLGLVFTLGMGVMLIFLPRKYALVPVVIMTCFMSMGQAIVIMDSHFTMIRILVFFGWARLLLRREIYALNLNAIDKMLIIWTISSIVLHTLLWQTVDEFINRLGVAYNAIGMYFLFRFLVRDLEDIRRGFKITAVLIIPLAAAMVMEKMNGRNMFAVWGDVDPVTTLRDGVVRCQGPFAHPILAGTFGATLLPFFVALWQQKRGNTILAGLAIISSTIITITSGSSGPLLAFLAAVATLGIRPWRKYLPILRWAFVMLLAGLQLVMKAPVWFLMARMDIFSGSTGFHRSYLIDQAIAHLADWWLLGTKSIESWGEQLHGDVTNQYIWEGINGGLLTMVLFILIIVRSFRAIGRIQELAGVPLATRRFVWALSASLLAHVVTYLSTSYFDQNVVNWFLLLALIATVSQTSFAVRPREESTADSQAVAAAEVGGNVPEAAAVHFYEV